MTDLTITHTLGADRVVRAYRIQSRTTEFSLDTVGTTVGGSVQARGDRLANPTEVAADIEIWAEGSLEANAELAYTIIAEAEAATQITWHEGALAVGGLMSFRPRAREDSVLLRLVFAPRTTSIAPGGVVYAGSEEIYAGSELALAGSGE